jgi:hypothetical protein
MSNLTLLMVRHPFVFPVMHRDATAITANPLNTRFAPLPAHVLTDAAATA